MKLPRPILKTRIRVFAGKHELLNMSLREIFLHQVMNGGQVSRDEITIQLGAGLGWSGGPKGDNE